MKIYPSKEKNYVKRYYATYLELNRDKRNRKRRDKRRRSREKLALRNKIILHEYLKNTSMKKIAVKFNLSVSGVKYVVSKIIHSGEREKQLMNAA